MLLAAGCTIEVGPPPESDPPLVPESAKAPPPPPQPTEPQAWSRDLDLDSGPTTIDSQQVAEGLVASDTQGQYSGQRLTFLSAFEEEQKLSEAEQLRQRARERAAAAGLPAPPEVSAAPLDEVTAQSLPEAGTAPRRESRLPPPPKFPPLPPQDAGAAAEVPAGEDSDRLPEEAVRMAAVEPEAAAQAGAAAPAGTADVPAAAADDWSKRQSRLPAPPKFPPLPAPQPAAEAAAPPAETQVAAVPDAASAGGPAQNPAVQAADFAAEAWDAPNGTFLVQVGAVTDAAKVAPEWHRLQASYPEVLEPLRLVVEPAMLGERAAFYRLQAGGFGSEAGAAATCDVLISAGQSCFVVVR